MKIVYMGTPEFSVTPLKVLLENGYNIPAVVTVPDKPQGRNLHIISSPVKKFAVENGLNVLQPVNLRDKDFIEQMKDISPDLIIVIAFRILPEEVFSLPKLGTFNLHASLLPKYRGAAPITRAIMNGETKTGVTTFFLDKSVDTGNIIIQRSIDIAEDDDYGTLSGKLSVLGSEVTLDTVKLIESGNIKTTKQDDSLSSPAPKIFKEDCLINWSKTSTEIYNHIRALHPEPTAFTHLEGKVFKVLKAKKTDTLSIDEPGVIVKNKSGLFVNCADKLLELREIQIEGKKPTDAKSFLNGYRFASDKIRLS